MINHGNCHCGSYRFELEVSDGIERRTECSCIACKKQGYIWLATASNAFKVVRDDGKLAKYSSPTLTHEVSGRFLLMLNSILGRVRG